MNGAISEAAILADLARILADFEGREYSGPIGRETRFFADLGLASIDAVVLGETLQEHYGRPLPFGELMADLGRREDRDLSIGDLADFPSEGSDETDRLSRNRPGGPAMPKLKVNGLTMHVQQAGEGPDVVLIHGITGDLSIWFLCRAMTRPGRDSSG